MRYLTAIVAPALLVAALGCSDLVAAPESSPPSIYDGWRTEVSPNFGVGFREGPGGEITGNGKAATPTGSVPVTVAWAQYVYPHVSVVFVSAAGDSLHFEGTFVDADRIDATLDGLGLVSQDVVLYRYPS